MEDFFKTSNIIRLILRWKWHLLVVLVAAIISSTIFSGPFFIRPKYKSFAIIYPLNLTPYSDENNTEQLLQFVQSEDLLFRIAQQYKLHNDYNIDSTDIYFRTKLIEELSDDISIRKTEYESVVIEVYHYNPQQAYKMVLSFIELLNLKIRDLHHGQASEMVAFYNFQLQHKKHQIDSIESRLQQLRKEYNILDYKSQVKVYSKSYLQGNGRPEVNKTLDNIKEYGGEFKLLETYLWGLTNDYHKIKSEYDNAVTDLNKKLTYSNVVTQPIPAEKKSTPIRWLIVVITSTSAVLLALLLLFFLGSQRKKENLT